MNLPILEFENQILEAVATNPVTVIQAETGAGKSTQVPKMLFLGGYSNITITQPRVMAAISLATRVSEEFGETVGKSVGYKTRFYKTEEETPITYVTDGYLLSIHSSETSSLDSNEVIILDEIHEFNLNQETLLGLYKKIEANPNLKLVVMSATVDAEKISNFFGGAPIIKVPGKLYPVEHIWEPTSSVKDCIVKYYHLGTNMLVFLPGKAEISNVYSEITERFLEETVENERPQIFQLHGEMSYEEQKKVFEHYENGKIILATNVAQTSITVPDIDLVIDTATCKQMVSENGISKLVTVNVSKADCLQRAGRAGRCKAGKYVLCSSTDLDHRMEFSIPEIQRISLENLVLKLATMDINSTEIEFLHNPDRENLVMAKKLLEKLGAIEDGHITPIGIEMEKMPVSARTARMLWEARKYSPEVQGDIAIIAAILECGDFRSRDFRVFANASEECRKSDLTYQLLLVKEINALWHSAIDEEKKNFYRERGIKSKIYTNILKVSKDIADKLNLKYMLFEETKDIDYRNIRACIISAYHDSLYVFSYSWKGLKYRGSDTILRTLDRSSVVPSWSTPRFVLAQPLDIDVKNGYYGPHTINLLKNVTEVEMDNELLLQALLSMAEHSYFYDQEERVLYDVFTVGNLEIKRERSRKVPTFKAGTDLWGDPCNLIMVDGLEVGRISA